MILRIADIVHQFVYCIGQDNQWHETKASAHEYGKQVPGLLIYMFPKVTNRSALFGNHWKDLINNLDNLV